MYQLVGCYRNVSGKHVPVWHDPYSENELIGCMANAGGYRVPALPNGFGQMNWPILGCTEKIEGKKVPVIDYDACCMCENAGIPTPPFLKVAVQGITMVSCYPMSTMSKSFDDVRVPWGEFYVKFCYSDPFFGSCTWKGVYTGHFGSYKFYDSALDCTGNYAAYKADRFLLTVTFYKVCSEENPTVQNRIEIGCQLYSTELAAACQNTSKGYMVQFGGLKYNVEPGEGECLWTGYLTGSELKITKFVVPYPMPYYCNSFGENPYSGYTPAYYESGAYLGVGLGQIESCTNWLPDVHYEQGDCVVQDGIIYWCIRDHLSTLYGEDKPLSGSNWPYYWCVNDGYC